MDFVQCHPNFAVLAISFQFSSLCLSTKATLQMETTGSTFILVFYQSHNIPKSSAGSLNLIINY